MEQRIIKAESGAVFLEKDGIKYTAIKTGLDRNAFRNIRVSDLKASPGLIIRGEIVEEWKIGGLAESEASFYFYGPVINYSPLDIDGLTESGTAELIQAFGTALKYGCEYSQFCLDLVFRIEGGGYLFAPPAAVDFIFSNRAEELNAEYSFPYGSSPADEKSAAFTAASIVYRRLTGKTAFHGGTATEIRIKIRELDYESVQLYCPCVKPELLNLINDSFRGKIRIDEWIGFFKRPPEGKYESSILMNSLTQEETELIQRKINGADSRRIFRKRIREFLIRKGTAVKIAAAVFAVVLFVSVPLIKKSTGPSVTAGLPQQEVVSLYYQSYANLDHETMDACLSSGAETEDPDLVTRLAVIVRTRQAYEGDSAYMDAESWSAAGRPPVKRGTIVWGPTDLKIERISSDSFRVGYRLWSSFEYGSDKPESELQEYINPASVRIIDTVRLSKEKGNHEIAQLTREIME